MRPTTLRTRAPYIRRSRAVPADRWLTLGEIGVTVGAFTFVSILVVVIVVLDALSTSH